MTNIIQQSVSNTYRLTLSMKTDEYDKLNEMSLSTERSMSFIARKAILEYYERWVESKA
jgi:hypothetical protein